MTRTESIDVFTVEDGMLVRSVTPARGKPYVHRCSLEVFREVAHLVDESHESGFTLEELVERAEIPAPFTQAAVALAFMKERGCVVTRRRRSYPASDFAYEDAMIEYHALREKGLDES